VSAAAYLALAEWHLGDVERARQLIDRATQRAEELGQAAAMANALFWKSVLETRRNDASATRLAADALLGLTEEYGLKTYADIGQMYANWAHGLLLDPEVGESGLRQALAAYIAQRNKSGAPSFHGLLAELEAITKGPESGLKLIDQGLAIADGTGEHYTDPYLHRLRGDNLLKRNPADSAPAEGAYQSAIAIAKGQSARSYILLASLALAKLYQATGRQLDAHVVLTPALVGFSPTPEMPEIAEAMSLASRLA
jgi:predicted ATPase